MSDGPEAGTGCPEYPDGSDTSLSQGPGDGRFWETPPPAAFWSPDGTFIIIGRRESERSEPLAWEGVIAEAVTEVMEHAAQKPQTSHRKAGAWPIRVRDSDYIPFLMDLL